MARNLRRLTVNMAGHYRPARRPEVVMKKVGFALAGLVAALMTGEAYAAPIAANGSFGFIPFETVSVDTGNISTNNYG
jgi:hypothetical protein